MLAGGTQELEHRLLRVFTIYHCKLYLYYRLPVYLPFTCINLPLLVDISTYPCAFLLPPLPFLPFYPSTSALK